MGGISGSREPNPQAVSALTGFDPGRARSCAGCVYLDSFKPRPDEQRRYGFGEIGYGCKEPGFEGYVQPDHPICVRGPYLPQPQGANQ